MIYIDFQGGAHGNYLEFVCNRFLAGIACEPSPFNLHGSSHSKVYLQEPVFVCGHFFSQGKNFIDDKIVSIQISHDDLLPLQSISLLRAGDHGLVAADLEKNTFNKLNNHNYRWILDNILEKYFHNQLIDSYQSVAAPGWPSIQSLTDFENLPAHIKQECIDVHHLMLYQFDQEHPNCPRHVLREFFKFGFLHPVQHGFIVEQHRMVYHESCQVHYFPFGCLYDLESFIKQLEILSVCFGYQISNVEEVIALHNNFLERQPYRFTKIKCDDIVQQILSRQPVELLGLDVLQEAYIDAQLELQLGTTMPLREHGWYQHSKEILL